MNTVWICTNSWGEIMEVCSSLEEAQEWREGKPKDEYQFQSFNLKPNKQSKVS